MWLRRGARAPPCTQLRFKQNKTKKNHIKITIKADYHRRLRLVVERLGRRKQTVSSQISNKANNKQSGMVML